jgi:hypothetical protein
MRIDEKTLRFTRPPFFNNLERGNPGKGFFFAGVDRPEDPTSFLPAGFRPEE